MTTTFTPGSAVAICGESARMLAGIPIDDARLPRLWEALRPASASAVDDALRLLLDEGFDAMPAFAVVAGDSTTARVVVRHPAVVEALVDGAPVTLSATPGGTWSDVTLERATSFVLRADAGVGTAVQLPLHVGVTPAGAVTVTTEGTPAAPAVTPEMPAPLADPLAEAPPAAGADEAPGEAPSEEAHAAAAEAPRADSTPDEASSPSGEAGDTGSPGAPASAAVDEGDEAVDATDDEPDPLAARAQTFHALLTSDTSDRDALLAQMAEEPDGPATAPEVDEVPAPATSLTAVWKADDAGSTDDEPADRDAADAADASPAPPAPPATPAAPAVRPEAPASGSSGLIDGVPWLSGDWTPPPAEPRPAPSFETPARPAPASPPAAAPRPPVAPEVRPTAEPEAREQQTLNRADLLKELGSAGIVGPSVLAVDCPAGHPTPAHEPTCRLCGKPVSDSQEPRQIPRPALGALVLANGDRLVLDKDAVLGRAPYEPEGSTERPHLLRVGESGEISRQHARITLDGWHVIVRDLGTANGTTLTLPGGSPQQLRANEDYQLENGAEIGIADIVTLRYEVTP